MYNGKVIMGLFWNTLGECNGTPLQYSCLENPMDRRAWWAAVHGVAKSWTWLSNFTLTFHFHATSLWLFTFMHWRRKWQPTPVFLPGESQGWGAWWAAVYGVAHSWTRLKWLSSSSSNPSKNIYMKSTSLQWQLLKDWSNDFQKQHLHIFEGPQYALL